MVAAAIAGIFIAGCGDVSAVDCGDGTFCPADTVCESGRCLPASDSCGDFARNTPCRIGDERGFCADAVCVPGVAILGQVSELGGSNVIGARVEAIDREWMDADVVEIGTFEVSAVAFDTDLVLRFSVANRLDMLTRRLTLTDADLIINEDENEPLRMAGAPAHMTFVNALGETYDPANGLLSIHLIRPNRSALAGGTVNLVGASAARALYFTSGTQPDPTATTTTAGVDGSSLVVFPNIVPGTYVVEIDHPIATICRATGDIAPVAIRADVAASTLTNIGEVICAPP